MSESKTKNNQITVFYFVLFSRSDHKLPFTIHLRVKFHQGKRIHDLGEDFAKLDKESELQCRK